jgi:hypothetical protein
MTTRLGLLACSVALGAIPMALTGCSVAANSAMPGSFSTEALHEFGGYAYRTIYAFRNTHGGTGPNGPLIAINGVLYGTTYFGGRGVHGNGTVFSLTTSGTEHVIYTFEGASDGINPNGAPSGIGTVEPSLR